MLSQRVSFYFGIFIISGVMMALQILQSRILSVTSWYHLSFVIVSLAMLGLTAGALKVFDWDEASAREHSRSHMQSHCIWFGIHIGISTLLLLYTPFNLGLEIVNATVFLLLAYEVSKTYFHAGVLITTALTRTSYPPAKVYGIDLIGAGFGCMLGLFIMSYVDVPSGMFLLAAITLFSSKLFNYFSENAQIYIPLFSRRFSLNKVCNRGALALLVVASINSFPPTHFLYPLFIKGVISPLSNFDYVEWNSISRVTVGKESKDVPPFLWGRSPITPADIKTSYKYLTIDGDAGTPITKFNGDISTLDYLSYDLTNLAYAMPHIKNSAIIGVGGGRDVLSAKYFGVEEVVAVDINPVQVSLLKDNPEFVNYAGVSSLDGVTLLNAEARSWFRQSNSRFDIIQMSLIDTWAATGSGAFALSENGLYTVEAWKSFLENLSPNGVFTVSRWATPETSEDMARAISVTIAALESISIENPRSHIVLARSGNIGNLIISRTPFTQEQLQAIETQTQEKQFDIVLFPGRPLPNDILGQLLSAESLKERSEIYASHSVDISPSTDMRPFFFNQARLSNPYEIFMDAFGGSNSSYLVAGQAKASASLLIIIILSFFAVLLVLVYPNLKTIQVRGKNLFFYGTSFFVLIGFGFMFVEISLMQFLGLFLGHPVYGLSVVLFSLILSSGIGSLLSGVLKLDTKVSKIAWSFLTGIYLFLIGRFLGDLTLAFQHYDLISRVLVSIALIAPAGILMGFGFPTGIKLVNAIDSSSSSWLWAVNGAAGVLGSSIALALNITFGIDYTLLIAGTCYVLLSVCILGLHRHQPAIL